MYSSADLQICTRRHEKLFNFFVVFLQQQSSLKTDSLSDAARHSVTGISGNDWNAEKSANFM